MDFLIHSVSFSAVFDWTLAHGYWIIFLAMLIEGPIVTSAAGFASALGYFNPVIIFIISILGDLVADVIYYTIGYWGRMTLVERFGPKFGLSKERMKRIENLMATHAVKTLLALKMTPVIPTPGLMLIGATRMKLRRFVSIGLLITVPKSFAFMVIGYFFGSRYDVLSKYVNNAGYFAIVAVGLIVLINYLYGKFSARVGRKLGNL